MAVVAFCPCPPVLLPALAQGAAAELDAVRTASDAVVSRVVTAARESGGPVTVLGAGPDVAVRGTDALWSFAGYGAAVGGGGSGSSQPPLALPAAVGAWLLDRCGWIGERRYLEVDDKTSGALPRDLWLELRHAPALLVMGDGAACHSDRAPLAYDSGAAAFDDAVAAALASGDGARLLALDSAEGARVGASGLPAWRALGAALAGRPAATARLVARAEPYGVGYLVAQWE